MINALKDVTQVLTGEDMAPWSQDWTGQYRWTPLCVVRPRDTAEVSAVMRLAHDSGTPVVPVSGHTGLSGGTEGEGAIMLSLDRLDRIEEIRPEARLARVGAGVILSDLHAAAAELGLAFPMTFGAKGSARLGGLLATNAGGSNVLRYGNTRDLVLGLEAVLADGRVVDLMSELHKNNTGYDLRHLLIGSEGTLGIVTRAVVKLVPQPRAFATAMVAAQSVDVALTLLNRLQDITGGAVEAFEFMPRAYMDAYAALHPAAQAPFAEPHDVNILVELGATAPRDASPGPDGSVPLSGLLEDALGTLFEEGLVMDAAVATSEAQRAAFWTRREAAAELSLAKKPCVVNDVAVPLDKVQTFLEQAEERVAKVDPQADAMVVAHLGDGNVHYAVRVTDAACVTPVMETVEDLVRLLGGTFSAEHGIGRSKLGSMARRKDPVALDMMRAIKAALDPKGILNPGKLLPPA
ncbi:FAD-binding oxidoreductase [Sagittula stellata]|uniref:FAD linked oxidase-like protein n=1 Tax=Sagittula stellata (strain ATCC 700073 / DSM 11524 / E-37) TaxID=388399 RepID=A3K5V0_SAGS3|nr:FAD-binding oxidoreductase [Sagittula stellata]EBA07489.1 FAD linked oxidase-like protein [Sagittula stellata E-37]